MKVRQPKRRLPVVDFIGGFFVDLLTLIAFFVIFIVGYIYAGICWIKGD